MKKYLNRFKDRKEYKKIRKENEKKQLEVDKRNFVISNETKPDFKELYKLKFGGEYNA